MTSKAEALTADRGSMLQHILDRLKELPWGCWLSGHALNPIFEARDGVAYVRCMTCLRRSPGLADPPDKPKAISAQTPACN